MIDRRTFLAATAAAVASPLSVPAGAAGWRLRVGERAITVKGRTATVYGLTGLDGRPGLVLDAGVELDVLLRNDLAEPTMIHWHGLAPPWSAAGVPDAPEAMIEPGGERTWRFPVGPGGTHLVHAHTLQAQNLLAAPLIVRTAGDRAAGAQEVVVLLQDFSFTPAGELLAGLIASTAAVRAGPDVDGGVAAVDHAAMAGLDHAGLDPATAPDPGAATTVVAPADETAVLSVDPADVAYDALLANDRPLSDPEVHTVERGAEVRLRIVNAAASTAFTVDLGTLEGALVAVDGRPVLPIPGRLFPLAMGQRIDVRLRLPDAVAAWPVIARAEGTRQRTGVVLVTAGAAIPSLADVDEAIGPPLDPSFDARLVAAEPLPDRPVDRRIAVDLAGMATGFAWAIQGAEGLVARRGERVELAIVNRTLTAQPMHLHGHRFQVTGLDALRFPGAVRDTVLVPPGATAVIAFDADNPGRWPFHSHHLYRMAAGMTTSLVYEDTD